MHFRPKFLYFLSYTYKTAIFWLWRTWLNSIISPLYPEVTLDIFRFLVSGRLASWWDVFWPPSRILDFRPVPLASKSTNDFGPWSTKLGGTVRATKKNGPHWQQTWSRQELRRNGRVFTFCQIAENGPKICFFTSKKHPKSAKRLIYLGKGYFLLCTTLPGGG